MTEQKRLYLSQKDKKIIGFCGGLAEYFNMDPSLVRLLFILITVLSGFIGGGLVYFFAWLIVPKQL